MKYLFFDLDGTLCESRTNLKQDMLDELERLSKKYTIIIVSGAEISRMLTQAPVPYAVLMSQNGNEVYEDGDVLWVNNFENKKSIQDHIELLAGAINTGLTSDTIEDRGSQISFSFLGHHAPIEEKKKFDPTRTIRSALLAKHPFHNALLAGTTCIDYVPYTKGQNITRYLALKNIQPPACLYIGDALEKPGNDSTVCGVIPTFGISGPIDTLNFIKLIK